jgi:hypothetical protein
MALGNQLILAGFAIAGCAFVAVLFLYYRLKHYVAKEKLHAVEDVSQPWKYGVPPKIVLSDKGLRLRQYANVSIVVLLVAAGILVIVSNLAGSSRQNVLPAIIVVAFLAATFLESRLKRHVSREKVLAVEDLSELWILGGVPEIVLNEKGLRLYRYMKMAAKVFFVGIGVVFVGIFVYGIPDQVRQW